MLPRRDCLLKPLSPCSWSLRFRPTPLRTTLEECSVPEERYELRFLLARLKLHSKESPLQSPQHSFRDGYCRKCMRLLACQNAHLCYSRLRRAQGRNACPRKGRTHCERTDRGWETPLESQLAPPAREGRNSCFSAPNVCAAKLVRAPKSAYPDY